MCISRGHSFSKSHFRAFHSIPLKQLTQHQLTQALHVFRPLAVAKIPWQWCCSSSQRRCSPRYSCDVLSLNIYSWRIWASHVIILCKMWATFGCVSSSFNETITNLKEAKLDTASKIYFGPSSQVLLFDVPLGAGKTGPFPILCDRSSMVVAHFRRLCLAVSYVYCWFQNLLPHLVPRVATPAFLSRNPFA